VIHQKFRHAREKQGLSQRQLAQQAQIPRSQLQILEQGGNVTLETMQKTVDQLDGLRLDIVPAGLDLEDLRRTAAELTKLGGQLLAIGERLLHAAGDSPSPTDTPAPTELAHSAVDAVHFEPGDQRDLEGARHSQRALEEHKRAKKMGKKGH